MALITSDCDVTRALRIAWPQSPRGCAPLQAGLAAGQPAAGEAEVELLQVPVLPTAAIPMQNATAGHRDHRRSCKLTHGGRSMRAAAAALAGGEPLPGARPGATPQSMQQM